MQLGSSDSLKSIYKVLYHSSKAGAKILLQKLDINPFTYIG